MIGSYSSGIRLMSDITNAPAAVGPYSQLAIVGEWYFLSGQLPLDPATGKLVDGGIEAQTGQVFNNIEAVLRGAGLRLSDVVRCSVYMTNMDDFPAMNAIYAKRFSGHKPAR